LDQLADPGIDLLNEIHLSLESLAETIANKVFPRLPSIVPVLMEIVYAVLAAE
jgi:hypothetical protein